MNSKVLRIGTRESQLAVWQANKVKDLLAQQGYESELVYIKSEGDIDLKTPLYEIGVQGIFTRSLDIALLNNRIDLAVHSMKDVPTQLPKGIVQSAVLERASYKDLLVYKADKKEIDYVLSTHESNPIVSDQNALITFATSSIRRKAQWLHRYPFHNIENLRGNVNTRLKKVEESTWHGAIFAAAGLERIGLRPEKSIELDWMLPAPAQGAIMVVCRQQDAFAFEACQAFHHTETGLCTAIEKAFLRTLMGGCSTPVSALAQIDNGRVHFRGNLLSVDGKNKVEIEKLVLINEATNLGEIAAKEMLANGGQSIADTIHHGK